MQHRQRFIDDGKDFHVIKDIEKEKKLSSQDKLEVFQKIEDDIKKVLYAFDNKKKIQIPKSLLNIENNNNLKNNNNDKNDKKNIYQKSSNLSFELSEYKRPDSYIIYSSKEREEIKPRDYEAKSSDYLFLEYNGDFMKIEVLEKIISTLENSIGKGEKIPDEMAKKIIDENFSKYKSKSDMIIKYFNGRRNELKKSLLRKYWRLQKSTDKYFTTTFRRRERDKMKIRKNNQKKEESFEKVKLASELCQTNILTIINSMSKKERLNRELMKLENITFLTKIGTIQKRGIPRECIEQNNNIISFLKENNIYPINPPPPPPPPPTPPKLEPKEVVEIECPSLNFSSLQKKINDKENSKSKYKVRIRINKSKKIIIDRYIQSDDSMDPFDDSFNDNIFKYQRYNPDLTVDSINYSCFENLFKEYYQQKYKFLEYIIDNDDDYELFLKNKKSNKRLLSKKRTLNK